LDLLAYDFRRHLGLRLTDVLATYTWREFAHLVSGVLSEPLSLTAAHFQREEPADE
jgi:hypothetical protein